MPRIIKDEQTKLDVSVTAHSFPNIHAVAKTGNSNGVKEQRKSVFKRINLGTAEILGPNGTALQGADGNAARDLDGQAAAMRDEAYDKGFSQGEKLGIEQEREKVQPLIDEFRQALNDLEEVKKNLYHNAERQAVDLAMAVARKIVCREVSINREMIIDVIKEALERVSDQERVKIRVSPCAVEFLNNPTCTITEVLRDGSGICIEEDHTIPSGGCIIETELGDIDARVEERLRAVEEAFNSELSKSGT